MEDKTSKPTQGHLEQNLSERIQLLYLSGMGHRPNEVSCQLIEQTLTIIVENPVTQPERLLVESGNKELAQRVRSYLHKAFQPQLKALIEEVVGVPVIELFGESKIDTGRTSIIAILASTPKISDADRPTQVNSQMMSDSDGDR